MVHSLHSAELSLAHPGTTANVRQYQRVDFPQHVIQLFYHDHPVSHRHRTPNLILREIQTLLH